MRGMFLTSVEKRTPPFIYHALISPSCSHVLGPMLMLGLIMAVVQTTGRLTLFSFHPIFMSFGCATCMSEALLVYRNGHLVNVFSDIMG